MLYGIQIALVRSFGRQGDVDGAPKRPGAAAFLRKTRSGVQGAPVLMQGNEQGVRIVPENVLAAVAVVYVRIHNGNAQGPAVGEWIMIADVLHHDGFVIDIAEATVAVHHAHGVVARRPYQGKGPLFAPLKHQPGRADSPARRSQMRIRTHCGSRRQAEVRALKLGMRGKGGAVFRNAGDVEQPFFKQLVACIEQALFPLRVCCRNGPVKGREKHHPETAGRHQRRQCFFSHHLRQVLQKYLPRNGHTSPYGPCAQGPCRRPDCFRPRP